MVNTMWQCGNDVILGVTVVVSSLQFAPHRRDLTTSTFIMKWGHSLVLYQHLNNIGSTPTSIRTLEYVSIHHLPTRH